MLGKRKSVGRPKKVVVEKPVTPKMPVLDINNPEHGNLTYEELKTL